MLNLDGVPYIDSAGLGEVVRTYTTVSRQGGSLSYCTSPSASRIARDHEAIDRVRHVRLRAGCDQAVHRLIEPRTYQVSSSWERYVGDIIELRVNGRPSRMALALTLSCRCARAVDQEPHRFCRTRLRRQICSRPLRRTLGAFSIFCALSGAVYLVNDVADRDADRQHPLKRFRPI